MSGNVSVGQAGNIDYAYRQWNKSDIKQLEQLKDSYLKNVSSGYPDALEKLDVEATKLSKDNLVQKLINCVTSSHSKEPFIKAVLVAFVLSHTSEKELSAAASNKLRDSIEVIFSHCPKNIIESAEMKRRDGLNVAFNSDDLSVPNVVSVPVGAKNICFGIGIVTIGKENLRQYQEEYGGFVKAVTERFGVAPYGPAYKESIKPTTSERLNTQPHLDSVRTVPLQNKTIKLNVSELSQIQLQDFINELLAVDVNALNEHTAIFTCIGDLNFTGAKAELKKAIESPEFSSAVPAPWTENARELRKKFDTVVLRDTDWVSPSAQENRHLNHDDRIRLTSIQGVEDALQQAAHREFKVFFQKILTSLETGTTEPLEFTVSSKPYSFKASCAMTKLDVIRACGQLPSYLNVIDAELDKLHGEILIKLTPTKPSSSPRFEATGTPSFTRGEEELLLQKVLLRMQQDPDVPEDFTFTTTTHRYQIKSARKEQLVELCTLLIKLDKSAVVPFNPFAIEKINEALGGGLGTIQKAMTLTLT